MNSDPEPSITRELLQEAIDAIARVPKVRPKLLVSRDEWERIKIAHPNVDFERLDVGYEIIVFDPE